MYRQAQWHADKAVRLHSPPVETALLLKVEALLALGKHAEALNEIRSLTVHGDPMATEVLNVRAQALYLSGTCSPDSGLFTAAANSRQALPRRQRSSISCVTRQMSCVTTVSSRVYAELKLVQTRSQLGSMCFCHETPVSRWGHEANSCAVSDTLWGMCVMSSLAPAQLCMTCWSMEHTWSGRAESITRCAGNMSMAENTYQVVLRLDPDNSSSRKGLKRIKLMNSSKNAGNEAFKAGKWREAEQHYTQALEVDSLLKSSFVAQCACNRCASLPFMSSQIGCSGSQA